MLRARGGALRLVFFGALCLGLGLGPASAAPWLFVSDVHFAPAPAQGTRDTDDALLASALTAMRRIDPEPPVVVIDGDFLAHHFDYARAIQTVQTLARRFDRTFPRAQFLIAFGNEDSGCGDYDFTPNSAFARAAARAWEPLVNRRGAAPTFALDFARNGTYTASLPVPHLHAVVVDDVIWSPRYHACDGAGADSALGLAALGATLRAGDARERLLLLAHIPPGVDVFTSTHVARNLAIVPFLDGSAQSALVQSFGESGSRLATVLSGHVHRFSFRIAGSEARPVPVIVIPAISPIFGNAPSFLTADVTASGTLAGTSEYSRIGGRWRRAGGFDSLGVSDASGAALLALHARLEHDAALRATAAKLYDESDTPEITRDNWRTYWCAQTALDTETFRTCDGSGGGGSLTARGMTVAAAVCLLLGVVATLVMRRRKRAPG